MSIDTPIPLLKIFTMTNSILRSAAYQKPTLDNSVHYMAHTFSFLATGEDTENAFTLIHCFMRKNFFPPPHIHQNEDESFYILEGIFEFQVGESKITAGPGAFVVLPKNVPHSFNLLTETAKALLLISPAGLEVIFKEFSIPAKTLDLPPVPEPEPEGRYAKMAKRNSELGIIWMPQI